MSLPIVHESGLKRRERDHHYYILINIGTLFLRKVPNEEKWKIELGVKESKK
jgi:hypothetical protein